MSRQSTGYSESVRYQVIASSQPKEPSYTLWPFFDFFKWGPQWGSLASFVLVITAVLLWTVSLDQINLRQMDDLGLVSVLPPSIMLSLLLINLSFCLAISQRPLPLPLLLVHVVALIVMLYGITAIVQEVPRFAIGWKLAGIIDYVMQTGRVDGTIDAFFNWPTFFVLVAFITKISGYDSAVTFMGWVYVFFNLLYLGPLWLIFRAATRDLRLVVLGLWFFLLANWIGQDYLAPQALNYFFFLTITAIILTWLRGRAWNQEWLLAQVRRFSPRMDRTVDNLAGWLAGHEYRVSPSTPIQRAALVVILVIIMMAMVSSHQLTPFATLAAITALIVFNRCTVLTLPIILGVLVATWVIYMAAPYISGHFANVSGPVGSVGDNLNANLTERFRGSPGHIFINYTRSVMSLAVWALAFFGGMRRFHNGYRDWGQMLLALTPFPLLLLQAYGGELLLRIYLYSAPFMVFFGAALFFPSPALGTRLHSTISLFGVSLLLMVGFFFTRYGNERMTYFTANEVDAMRYLYANAEPGSQFISATGTLPWRFQDYETYRYTSVPSLISTLR